LFGLFQALYIDKVLKRFSAEVSKRELLPFRHSIHISKSMCPNTVDERNMEAIPHALAIRSLMYAMLRTKSNIAHAINVMNKFQANLGREH
jgi:ATP-binding cassette subfamily B (MDR/TAP) protein 1